MELNAGEIGAIVMIIGTVLGGFCAIGYCAYQKGEADGRFTAMLEVNQWLKKDIRFEGEHETALRRLAEDFHLAYVRALKDGKPK